MKIIDQSKIIGRPFKEKNTSKLRIIINKKINKNSSGEKILLFKRRDNPFYEKKSSMHTGDFKEYFNIFNSIINDRMKHGSIEEIYFNEERKIKQLGYIVENISEINSVDPRFLFLWNYNPNIRITLYFNEQKIQDFNLKEFKKMFPKFEVSNKEHWLQLLLIFKNRKNPKIPTIGKAWFAKYVKLINNNTDSKEMLLNKITKEEYKERVFWVASLLKEMA